MAKVLNVEKATYLENQISIFSKNKIGQYSKFLDKNPIFVTYYHINSALSTQDVGTGNIESEIGSNSPIRFNKINNLPVFNIPTLKPDVTYDETGYDIELDCSDLVLLPNTIKPRSGDYFLVTIPGAVEYLFRVNNFSYNTIQSNDYYLFDADIKRIGKDLEETYVSMQIVETYETIFDNIGTADRCFIRSTDIDYINSLALLYDKLKDMYYNYYYSPITNTFGYYLDVYDPLLDPIVLYDPYMESFITKANIYYEETIEKALTLSPACNLNKRFNFIFNQSLYQAVLDRSTESLVPYMYCYDLPVTKRLSIFRINNVSVLARDLYNSNELVEDGRIQINWEDLVLCPQWIPVDEIGIIDEYFSFEFIKQLIEGERLDTNSYLEYIVFNYITNQAFTIDRKELLESIKAMDRNVFYYLPIVMYIINALYNEYFKVDNDLEYLT